MSFKSIYAVSFLLLVTAKLFAQVNCPAHLPLTLLGNTDYCIGSPGSELSINETYTGYEWLPTSETSQNVLLTAGSYQVVITHYTGCTDTLAFQVNQVSNPSQPVIDADGPTQFCQGESVVLSVPTWYPYYEWNTGSVSDEVTVFEGGTYVVSIEDWIGCSSSSNSVQVIVDPLPTAAFSPNLNMFDIEFANLSSDATDYEWNFGDGSTSTDFEPTYTYSASGILEMYLVASNNCGTDTAFLNLESVGIEGISESASFSIYPNPSNGEFSIEIGSSANTPLSMSIFNSLGQLVFSQSIKAGLGTSRFAVKDLPAGMYIVELRSGESNSTGRLFISK